MRLFGFFIITVLLTTSCKTDRKAEVLTPDASTTSTEAPKEKIQTAPVNTKVPDKTNIVLEEQYEKLEKVKPALEPTKQTSESVENVKTESKTDTKTKTIIETPPAQEETPKKVPVQTKEPVTQTQPTTTETKTEKPAILPKVIPTETVQNVPVDEPKDIKKAKAPSSKTFIHSSLDKLLSSHVSAAGKVNYKGLLAEVDMLDQYLTQLESTDISSLSKNERLAFWINAYNAFTIKKILENHPVTSITDLDGGKPWDAKWIKLDGKTLSLNNIENDIIRPKYKEPRIHFAVNCAAKSCPPLMNKAWSADNLEADFTRQTKAFVNNTKHNELGASSCTVSKIFEWYAEDFGDLVAFLNKYSSTTIDGSAKVSYREYDWSLNQ